MPAVPPKLGNSWDEHFGGTNLWGSSSNAGAHLIVIILRAGRLDLLTKHSPTGMWANPLTTTEHAKPRSEGRVAPEETTHAIGDGEEV